ncbi:hypothetical protein [Calidifontibacillus erzurumensis]|uniref:hypothetical protein n=1 Tax=Calidifontibacillus erzurumensis TaxID=2741433 RepID=UPI0035B53933
MFPWISMLFMRKREVEKYLYSVIFISFLTKAIDKFGEKRKWWRFYKGISLFNSMDFFIMGPYLVSSFWMLKWFYGKFVRYLVMNVLMQSVFAYLGGVEYAERFKIFKLVRISKWQYILSTFIRAIALYGFQYFSDFCVNGTKKAKDFIIKPNGI